MFAGKPIIGIAGGIGSGKSTIARLFGEAGCLVLSADEQVREVYRDPEIKRTLRGWWGDQIINSKNEVDRRAVAGLVFDQPDQRKRLEELVHPRVARLRQAAMAGSAADAAVLAFIWDIPLLFEAGLSSQCDAIVFVDAPRPGRLERLRETRGWDDAELSRRENFQMPLDFKRRMSNYIVRNTADMGFARTQVRDVLSAILHPAMNSDLRNSD